MAISCLIIDDSVAFLEAARTLLERQGVIVCGLATCSTDALILATRLRPDVLLIDIDLGDESGLDLAHSLAGSAVPAEVILISAHAEEDFTDLVAAAPARGFLPKTLLSAQAIHDLLATGD